MPKHSLSVIEHMIDPKRKTRLRDFFATPTHYDQHMRQFVVSKVDAFNASLSPRVEEMQLVKKYKNLLYEEQSKTDFGIFEEPKFMHQPTFHNQKLNNLFEQYVDPVAHQRVSILKNQQTKITDIKVAIEPTFKNVSKPVSKPQTPKNLMKRKRVTKREPAIRIQNHCTSTQRSSQCLDIDTQILEALVGPENPVPAELQTSFVEELIKKDKEKMRFNSFNLASSSISGTRASFKGRELPDNKKTEQSVTNEDLYVVKQAPFITVRTNARQARKKTTSPGNQRSLPIASKIIQIDHIVREPAGQKARTPFSAAVNAQLLVKRHNQASRGSASPPPPKKTLTKLNKAVFKVELPLIQCN